MTMHRTAFAVPILLLLATGSAAALLGSRASTHASSDVTEFDPAAVATLLHRAGLTPDAMAAAGLNTDEVALVITYAGLASLRPGFLDSLENATARFHQARAAAARPARLSPSSIDQDPNRGPPTPEPAPGPGSLTDARNHLEAELTGAFDFITAALPPAKRQTLAAIRRHADRGLPAPYLVADRTEAQWLALRNALAARRIAQRLSRPLPDAAAQFIAQAEAEVATASALLDHAALADPVRSAWTAALPR